MSSRLGSDDDPGSGLEPSLAREGWRELGMPYDPLQPKLILGVIALGAG